MSEPSELNLEMASLIKGMLKRGDRQSDIAACFLINSGRIAEINTGQRFMEAVAAAEIDLPPAGPYPSPYDLWRTKNTLWGVRVALEAIRDNIDKSITAVARAEGRL